jgi:hypothetical protein
MSLTDDGLLLERPNGGIGGVQRLYRWGSGGLSLVDSPMLHSYPFAWEAGVLAFNEKGAWSLTYETPLSQDVEVFSTEDEANTFILKAKAYFEANADPEAYERARKHHEETRKALREFVAKAKAEHP